MSHQHLGPPPFQLTPETLDRLRHDARTYRDEHGGLLPPTKDWNYLVERYEAHPARFAEWHPLISRWIAEDLRLLSTPISVDPPTSTVVCVPPQSTPGGAVGVPEPSSIVLWVVGIIWFAMRRKK